MNTDKHPRKAALKEEYVRSDDMLTMWLPPEQPLRELAAILEQALSEENRLAVQRAANNLSSYVTTSCKTKRAPVRVLGARPLDVSDEWVDETFGDYTFETARIRLWMRTAVHKKVTAYGTLLSTLCHELCHHLDVVAFDLPNTYHTRGFYQRAAILYHHARGTPFRKLVWSKLSNGTYAINWPATMRGASDTR